MNNLKQIRKEKHLTQASVASMLGINQNTYSYWENGKVKIDNDSLKKLSDFFDVSIDYILGNTEINSTKKSVKIPVIGRVAAGIPFSAVENIIDYEEIEEDLSKTGDFFALQIHGNSMEPRFCIGDVVIVRQQSDVDSGSIAIVLINGEDATCKKVMKHTNGITLISLNPAYQPVFYTNEEIETLPVRILGKVIELRAKF